MNVDSGEIRTPEEMKRLRLEATGGAKDSLKGWTQFGMGDVVSLYNLANTRIGWFRVQLVAKRRVSLRPISEREAEEEAKKEGLV